MLKLWFIFKKAYRETSLLATVLTEHNQLLRVVARGGRGVLSEFQPVFGLVKKSERSSLFSLNKVELAGPRIPLQGKELISGLYVNEITATLVPECAEVDGLFDAYCQVLVKISENDFTNLRRYERFLLDASGVYPDLQIDRLGEAIRSDAFYRLNQYENLVEVQSYDSGALLGSDWMRLAESQYEISGTAQHAKWLHRMLISHVTGGRRIVSRDLLSDLGAR